MIAVRHSSGRWRCCDVNSTRGDHSLERRLLHQHKARAATALDVPCTRGANRSIRAHSLSNARPHLLDWDLLPALEETQHPSLKVRAGLASLDDWARLASRQTWNGL